jgi:hypothetical protein
MKDPVEAACRERAVKTSQRDAEYFLKSAWAVR